MEGWIGRWGSVDLVGGNEGGESVRGEGVGLTGGRFCV